MKLLPTFGRFALIAAFVVASANGCSKVREPDDPRRHHEPTGGFSYIPPEGWKMWDSPFSKFHVAMGTPESGFAPNINVVKETFPGTLDAYTQGNLEVMPKVFKKYRLIRQDSFQTSDGVDANRLLIENEQEGFVIRQIMYALSRDQTKIVVTCSALADDGEKFDNLFDQAAKSFRFEP